MSDYRISVPLSGGELVLVRAGDMIRAEYYGTLPREVAAQLVRGEKQPWAGYTLGGLPVEQFVLRELNSGEKLRCEALREAARKMGRRIITGGGYWGTGYQGAVQATYPDGSTVANADSWTCHHGHADEERALACALDEVTRLAAGGEYRKCSDGEECTDKLCRDSW